MHTPSSGSIIFQGNPIASNCSTWNGYTNYNAYTGFQTGSAVTATPALNISEQVCIAGFGVNNFAGLCSFACGLGYCPVCIMRNLLWLWRERFRMVLIEIIVYCMHMHKLWTTTDSSNCGKYTRIWYDWISCSGVNF